MKRFFLIILIISLCIFGCSGYNESTDSVSKSGFYFDTIIQITLYDTSEEYAIDACLEMADKYEKLFSDTIDDSDISRINSSPGVPTEVDADTAELINIGLSYSSMSEGTFDITVGNLSKLWRFDDSDDFVIPDPSAVENARVGVDYNKVTVDGNYVTLLSDDCAIDLGGIAKGYIADKMKEYLISEGITAGFINLGGNVLTLDEKPMGETYTIGIQKPFSDDGTPILSVDILGKSVVTSGTYQRYAKIDDTLYHHIISLDTGYPADNGLSSVSIICTSSTDADALSTIAFLMGKEKGMSFIEDIPDTEAIFITTDNELLFTSGMGDSITYKEY